MRKNLLLALIVMSGCAELEPDAPASKLNNAPSNTQGANNGSTTDSGNTAGNDGANNGTTGGQTTSDAGIWGTEGPSDTTGKSPDGNAFCELADVVTADLGEANESEVPADPWDAGPVVDTPARCGDDLETLVWRLHNCERIGRGMPPLACDLRLVWAAREHTLDMIRQDYFRHDNPAGESPFDRLNRHSVNWGGAAENIAQNETALGLHHSWMDSTGHRGNILGNYTHAGLGIEPNRDGLLGTAVFVTLQ